MQQSPFSVLLLQVTMCLYTVRTNWRFVRYRTQARSSFSRLPLAPRLRPGPLTSPLRESGQRGSPG